MDNMELEFKMLNKDTWAVVGANNDPEKYGNMIYRKLKEKGYKVYPVNPKYKIIDGDPCYASLRELPEVPDVIDMVVNPRVGLGIIEEADEIGVKNIWFQPGTYNQEIIEKAKEKGIKYVTNCVLVILGWYQRGE